MRKANVDDVWELVCLMSVAAIVIHVFYFLTLYRALRRVRPRNREMEPPGLVWLGFIPLFNLYWNFVIATRIPDSLRNELRERGQDHGSDCGKGIGLAYAVAVIVMSFVNIVSRASDNSMPMLIRMGSLATLLLFILFWVRIALFGRRLGKAPVFWEEGRDEDRDDDDEEGDFEEGPVDRPAGPASEAIRPKDPGRFR
jgi:hypothetical protein